LAINAGYEVKLSGAPTDRDQAQAIAAGHAQIEILPHGRLGELAAWLHQAKGAVAVDSGLANLAAAVNVPTVTLYGPTDPGRQGAYGRRQVHLYANYPCAPCMKDQCHYQGPRIKNQLQIGQGQYVDPPCFSSLMPGYVFQTLMEMMTA
jgi:heptosyltransferase-1